MFGLNLQFLKFGDQICNLVKPQGPFLQLTLTTNIKVIIIITIARLIPHWYTNQGEAYTTFPRLRRLDF